MHTFTYIHIYVYIYIYMCSDCYVFGSFVEPQEALAKAKKEVQPDPQQELGDGTPQQKCVFSQFRVPCCAKFGNILAKTDILYVYVFYKCLGFLLTFGRQDLSRTLDRIGNMFFCM